MLWPFIYHLLLSHISIMWTKPEILITPWSYPFVQILSPYPKSTPIALDPRPDKEHRETQEKLWDRNTLQLVLTSILRKFLCILKIREFFLGVTWRSCGIPEFSTIGFLSKRPVQISNYKHQSIQPWIAVYSFKPECYTANGCRISLVCR